MPEIAFDLVEGISKDVFEKSVSYYFGRGAEIVKRKGTHYVIDASCPLNQQSIIRMLRDDTTRWRKSDEYKEIDYSQSRVYRDRKRSAPSHGHTSGPRRDSTVAGVVTPPIPIVAQRPGMPHRYSSTSGSVADSTFGSSYQNTHSFSQSSMYSSQSRRPSDAVLAGDPGFRSRTMSVSSTSSDYGIDGIFGWRNDTGTGTDGYYGWKQDGNNSARHTSRR